jgi:hypothetical protein
MAEITNSQVLSAGVEVELDEVRSYTLIGVTSGTVQVDGGGAITLANGTSIVVGPGVDKVIPTGVVHICPRGE